MIIHLRVFSSIAPIQRLRYLNLRRKQSLQGCCVGSCNVFCMQMESQVPLASEVHAIQENTPIQAGDPSVVCSVSKEHCVKKTTRQWAAWTREEEENFFTALRHVGKNFEKITCRVQSKNKDQVRHYYYRLVRRMNKLLGPGLYLDAKNSKDTNAAMLRWWSLLEKYSCRASKLHLKPRRFKVFLESLEHLLLKDRKKNMKKRPSQLENNSPTSPNTISSQGRASGHETHTVKLVLVDSQNIQKLGPGKGTFKRTTSMNCNKSSTKGEMGKASRQRRKPGASAAAYKKWEKAAIDGVSLVADAAEHLERTDHGKVECSNNSGGGKVVAVNLEPSPLLNVPFESSMNSNGKLKLQLFPIDDVTRSALEVDKHNPHLELTLSTRKKISSVLEHLNRKWGDSSAASGELMLFPYGAQMENMLSYQRWTQTSNLSAADVYAMIGSPPVFRLRYGWFADTRIPTMTCQAALPSMCNLHVHDINTVVRKDHGMGAEQPPPPLTYEHSEKHVNFEENQSTSQDNSDDFGPPLTGTPNKMHACHGSGGQNDARLVDRTLCRREHSDGVIMAQTEDEDGKNLSDVQLSAGEWVDSLTNISVGDLLSDVPDTANAECVDPPVSGGSQYLQQIPFNCDSFDAVIAAQVSIHQKKMGILSKFESHATSILDAEETCDAFSFQKNRVPCSEVHAVSGPISSPQTLEAETGNLMEGLPKREVREAPLANAPSDDPGSQKDFSALTDIYWPDSLGPLDLDLPSSKYHSTDLIIGDSYGGLNGLIASSVDAFQNCSFFSLEKKQPTSTTEA